jgi:hopanoid biosynthesis associated protein HpnK
MRRLIVNADDFGFTSGVNRGIVEAHTHGIVTSTTLMANGLAFEDAVRLAKTVPDLSVGCHVVLIDGQPMLDASKLPTLTAAQDGDNQFRGSLKIFAARALTGGLESDEIEAEATVQIQKLQSAGIPASHVDTHKHTHLFPSVLRPLLRAARACGVGAVRNPLGPRRPLRSGELLARPNLWTRYAEVRILRTLAGKFCRMAKEEGLATTDGTLGVVVTGVLDEKLFRHITAIIPEGTWEFVCHPGYNDEELQRANTRLRLSRETELRVLTMPAVRELLADSKIELISYRDLLPQTQPPAAKFANPAAR